MTLHVVYSYSCPQCQAHYIPYKADVVCPRCGAASTETFDYIPQAAQSIAYNLDRYGSYIPPAWWVGSLGDHILNVMFPVFERFRLDGATTDFSEFALMGFSAMNWGDQLYLRDHIITIATLVYDEIQRQSKDKSE
jgi:hypothetical protein